ncbi:MAG: asparagine synthase (glutamine-hydrolyzing) [Deltaproteobacteria bacterium]|nr:asparagine synthase (glutamine-hydrolyzing) [Deltaproteobacteria bacterium]
MCGIFGAIAVLPGAGQVQCRDIAPMSRALAHRGPDGAALCSFGWAAIGMTRLGIVAPDEAPQIYTAGNRYFAVQNGELYNHRSLRRLVGKQELAPSSATDSALLPALYARFGEQFTDHLRGPFAIALVDLRDRALHLYRSPLGEKPLYYARGRDRLFFASEVKALIAAGAVRARVRPSSAARFLWRGVLDEDEPLLEGVEVLPPGGHLCVTPAGVVRQTGSRLEALARRRQAPAEGIVERTAALLVEAVELRARADVPAALLLSGGLDSSVVGAATRGLLGDAFTLAVPNADESESAAQVARTLGLRWHCVRPPPPTPARLAKALWHLEIPDAWSAYGMATAFAALAAAMHAAGYRVALSGEGADEVYLGYAWDAAAAALEHGWRLSAGSEARRILGEHAPRLMGITRLLLRASGAASRPRDCWLAAVDGEVRDRVEQTGLQLLTRRVRKQVGDALSRKPAADAAIGADAAGRGSSGARGRQLSGLTHDMLTLPVLHADRLLMAHGVEARMPFLDLELVALALRTPPDLLERPGIDKPLLRALAKRLLPARLCAPEKRGFTAAPLPPQKTIVAMAGALGRDPGLAVDSAALSAWSRGRRAPADPVHLKVLWRAVLLETTLRVLQEGPQATSWGRT